MWVNKSLQQSPIFLMWRPKSVAPFIQIKWDAFKISAKINTITSVSQHTDLKSRAEMNQRLIFSSANQIHMLGLYSTGLMKEIPACRCKAIPWLRYEFQLLWFMVCMALSFHRLLRQHVVFVRAHARCSDGGNENTISLLSLH